MTPPIKFKLHFESFLSEFITSHSFDNKLRQAALYATLNGGKRTRPQLCMIFAGLTNQNIPETDILYAASALELIHCYSLVHDDLPAMDNDDLRRGKPTTHKKYNEATAILVGDCLQSMAFEALTHPEFKCSLDIKIKLVQILSGSIGAKGMVNGQFQDMYLDDNFDSSKLDHVKSMHHQKTGALITASCQFGALLTNDNNLVKEAEKIGNLIGALFQLQDDILDITQSSQTLGKTAGKDQETDKPTITALMGLDAAKQYMHKLSDELKQHINNLDYNTDILMAFINQLLTRKF